MKKKLITIVILAAAALPQLTMAQSGDGSLPVLSSGTGTQKTVSMSLEEAQRYALAGNLSLRNAFMDVEKAQKAVWETTANGLPQLAASGQYQHMFSELMELEVPAIPAVFPGGKFKLGVKDSFNGSLTLNQLIFSGSYIVGVKTAKAYRDYAELGVEKGQIEVASAVAQSYYMCLVSAEAVEILKENISLLEKTLGEMRKMEQHGFLDRTSVDQVEVTTNALTAQLQSLKRQQKNALDLLKYVIGAPMDQPIELTDNLKSVMVGLDGDYINRRYYDQSANIDMRMSEMDLRLGKLQVDMAKVAYLPTIGAQVGVMHNFTMPELAMQTATTIYLGASVQIPLFTSGMTHAKVQQAKLSMRQAENRAEQTRQQLDLKYQSAVDSYKLAWDTYQVQLKNLDLSARIVDDIGKALVAGMKGSTDLLQANGEYVKAVGEMINAKMSLLNAKTELDKLLVDVEKK